MTRPSRTVLGWHRPQLVLLTRGKPAPPEPPTTPELTVYQGRTASGITAGNRLVIAGHVTRGDS